MLQPGQQRMPQPGLDLQRKNSTAPRQRGGHLTHAPRRIDRRGADQTDHGVRPAQPLVQPLLPVLAHPDTTIDIPVQEDLMAGIPQPTPNPPADSPSVRE